MSSAPSSEKTVLSPELVEALREDVVPHIVETCRQAQDAYDLDQANNDNYVVGTYSWRNLFNRLRASLDKKKWAVMAGENDLRLSYKAAGEIILFRVHRCDSQTRLPTGGKMAKKHACDQYILSPEIEQAIRLKAELVISYDIDPLMGGLGSITVEQLAGPNPKEVVAFPLAILYHADRMDLTELAYQPRPEPVASPTVKLGLSKNTSGTAKKKANEDG